MIDLKEKALARAGEARAAAQVMDITARTIFTQGESVSRELNHIIEDLDEHRAKARDADSAADAAPLVSVVRQERPPLRVGDIVASPGPELVIYGTSASLRDRAASWRRIAQRHRERADTARLAITDHAPIGVRQREAEAAARAAQDAETAADDAAAKAKRVETRTQETAQLLLQQMREWTKAHPSLTEPLESPLDAADIAAAQGSPWGRDEIEQLAEAEPSKVLVSCDTWARHAVARAEQLASGLLASATQASAEAKRSYEEAGRLRAEAEELRRGRLLPLPRPEWAGPADDDARMLGALLDWREGMEDAAARARLEAAMAAAGLLGVSLSDEGASTRYWHVEPTGPIVTPNLGDVLTVDGNHSLSEIASAVLARIQVRSGIPTGEECDDDEQPPVLSVGRDGTFHAGVLRGRVPGADDPSVLPSACHIGGRQRREAALARATQLEAQAADAEAHAASQATLAGHRREEAAAMSAAGQSVPSREELRSAEATRSEVSRLAREARDRATAALDRASRAADAYQEALEEWLARLLRLGLPADLAQLQDLQERGVRVAERLEDAATPLAGKLADRLDRTTAQYSAEAITRTLIEAESAAQLAFRVADESATEVRVLEEVAGAEIQDVLARHAKAGDALATLEKEHGVAHQDEISATSVLAAAGERHNADQRRLREEVLPNAARRLLALRTLLDVPGVAHAVLGAAPSVEDDALVEQVGAKLQGRRRLTAKTVLERFDVARTRLAGIWSLDPGETHGTLLTFVLTFRDGTYTPVDGAAEAARLKEMAEQALAASEERALRDFVIGRLPNAIGTAWIHLRDWVDQVNKKMLSAAASSGVAVQVRTPLVDDLAPASRDVFELSCRTSSADRTSEQQRRLGEALRALLDAAPGETMLERVAKAVDIRDWVEVQYEVLRPGGTRQRWTSRTGLSGGERRLVVLAPMLAAIAAGYDRLGTHAFRLLTLDEVPAEVDDRGREGLARYIAELDLDLICTSYGWDGCPGAWDGIDAHDLESGLDETVVSFPMLTRGITPIPEDGLASNAWPTEPVE